ncbi:MAG TPA: VOC family protein [Terriglobales bacterium]|nr:VOC family protein [Terriglobales bacterium]
MITGTHVLFYSTDAEADRAFFRDILGFSAVDAGGGWLIFALPPAEAGIHPVEKGESRPPMHGGRSLLGAVVYLMCDDLAAEMERLRAKKVECSPAEAAEWGKKTTLRLPSGGEIGLYQPRHPTALDLKPR